MIRASLLCVLIGASAALSACDIPPASFDGSSSGGASGGSTIAAGGATGGGGSSTTVQPSGGAGGMGGMGAGGGAGATGGTTTTTTTSTTGGGGTGGAPVEPQVPCTTNSTPCVPGQICCFHQLIIDWDHCGPPGDCCADDPLPSSCEETDYGYLECNGLEDCAGMKCCGKKPNNILEATYCAVDCTGSGVILMCKSNEGECGAGKVCQPIESGYPGYSYCK